MDDALLYASAATLARAIRDKLVSTVVVRLLAAERAWTRRSLAKAGTAELHPWLQRRIDEAQAFDVADYTTLPSTTTRR